MSSANQKPSDDLHSDTILDPDGDVEIRSLRFEEAITRIESIIDRIESGETGLENSLKEYEHGMKLITHCRGVLDTAQTKITELTADAEGHLRVDDDD